GIQLMYVVGQLLSRHEEGLRLGGLVEAAIARLGGDDDLTAAWSSQMGAIWSGMGEADPALDAIRKALAIRERRLDKDDPAIADTLNNLGNVLDDKGDYDGAIAAHERALAIRTHL